jgi:glycosyltransferase involved in cell wall biosynthesis
VSGDRGSARQRVLFVSVPTGVGGSTRSLATVMHALDRSVERVLAGPPAGRFVDLLHALDAVDRHLPVVGSDPRFRPVRRAWSAVRIAAYAVRHRDRVVAIHANGLKELSLALPAAFLSRVPLVVWVHNFLLPPSVRLLGPVWRLLLRHTEVRWAAVSPLSRDLVVDAGLTGPEAVRIVPNPIDPADVIGGRRPPDPDDRGLVKAAFLGAPRTYKGFHLLPAIIEATDPSRVGWLVFSQATDDDHADVWATLHRLADAGRVTIYPKEVDVRRAYERCDLVVCPSLLDSFCRVAAEAMLNEIPVVGSDIEPIRALLGPDDAGDEAGLLVPAGDAAASASAVATLAADPGLRRRLGANGRQRASAFDPASVCAALSDLYGAGRPVRPSSEPGRAASGPAPTSP